MPIKLLVNCSAIQGRTSGRGWMDSASSLLKIVTGESDHLDFLLEIHRMFYNGLSLNNSMFIFSIGSYFLKSSFIAEPEETRFLRTNDIKDDDRFHRLASIAEKEVDYRENMDLKIEIYEKDNIVGFIIILVLVMGLAAVVAVLLRTILRAIMLGWVDHIGGAVLGLVMGALSISALLAIIVKYTGSNLIADSALANFLLDKFPFVLGLLPSEFDSIRDFFD